MHTLRVATISLLSLLIGLSALIGGVYVTSAFTGPSSAPPGGGGLLRTNAAGTYLGIGTSNPQALFSLGTGVDAQKLLIYDSGNNRYGLGIQSFELRQFYPSDANFTIGTISTANGTTYTERVRVDSTGRVGIGSNLPSDPLEVQYANSSTNVPGIAVDTTGTQSVLGFRTGGTLRAHIRSDASGHIVFAPDQAGGDYFFGSSEGNWRMFIRDDGVVAVGTTSPAPRGTFVVNGPTVIDATDGYGARLSVGNPAVNYPANGGWATTWNSNIILSGLDSTSISFHDAGASVSSLRYQGLNFYLGENNGWGTSTLNVAGPIVLGRYAADPSGAPGMMYYNTASNTFRCYTTSWGGCGGGGAVYQ